MLIFLDEQVFLIESHRKKMLKIKIADLEADLEVLQFKSWQFNVIYFLPPVFVQSTYTRTH